MFAYFKQQLDQYKLPYCILEGNEQKRLQKAIEVVDELRKNSRT